MNINTDLSILLEDNEAYMKQFTRDAYADAFEEFGKKYTDLYDSIAEEYNNSDDKSGFIKELTQTLIAPVQAEYEGLSRAKRSNYLIDKNTLMVIYILPSINEYKGEYTQELLDVLIAEWNKAFNQKIKLGTFSEINAGFRRKLCYVTTAVCKSLGKSEDCEEIRMLKNYRDTYLTAEPDGPELIDTYYDIAPTIVNRINKCADSDAVYEQIYKNYIYPCISYIESDRLSDCKDLYVKMMHNLKDKYMI